MGRGHLGVFLERHASGEMLQKQALAGRSSHFAILENLHSQLQSVRQ